jgi:hypothetical protein
LEELFHNILNEPNQANPDEDIIVLDWSH